MLIQTTETICYYFEYSATKLLKAGNGVTFINNNKIEEFLAVNLLSDSFKDTISAHFVPLGEMLVQKIKAHSGCFYVGVNGSQGSGKSTLSEFLNCYLQEQKLRVAVLSLDDFYLNRNDRKTLASTISPLLATRGVPGTHDTSLMADTLKSLAQNGDISLPRFSKAQDNPHPRKDWPIVKAPVDVVIMEGWCWGVNSQTPLQIRYPINALEAEKDPNLIWRKWVNRQLKENYEPLYEMMDFWVMLQAPGFESVYDWRLEQEQKLAAKVNKEQSDKQQSNRVMSAAEVHAFIQYYQRLTEECLTSLPDKCDVVFKLAANREIVSRKGLYTRATS